MLCNSGKVKSLKQILYRGVWFGIETADKRKYIIKKCKLQFFMQKRKKNEKVIIFLCDANFNYFKM